MESADVGVGGVAVNTRETEPPDEQLATQPPPGTPLQAAMVKPPKTSRIIVEARRIGTPEIGFRAVAAPVKGQRRYHPFLPMYAQPREKDAPCEWYLPKRARDACRELRAIKKTFLGP